MKIYEEKTIKQKVEMIFMKIFIYEKKTLMLSLVLLSCHIISSQNVKYSTSWFGPNANPVPDMTDACIPAQTTVNLMSNYYFGYGDRSIDAHIKIEIPLLSQRVSMKLWSSVFEYFQTTSEIMKLRGSNTLSGKENGDVYIQTRIRLLNEQTRFLNIILNSTLKTAAANTSKSRRYFDTPGYYFDLELGKSMFLKNHFISELRGILNVGFMCWETSGSLQDDALMYGAKIIMRNTKWSLESSLSGYSGWMHTYAPLNVDGNYGDAPLVFASKITLFSNPCKIFTQYQYGIKDFPFHQIRLGVEFPINKLTPKF